MAALDQQTATVIKQLIEALGPLNPTFTSGEAVRFADAPDTVTWNPAPDFTVAIIRAAQAAIAAGEAALAQT